jgi:hypothetical protein
MVQPLSANTWRAVSPPLSTASRSAPAAINGCTGVSYLDRPAVRRGNSMQRRPTCIVTCAHVCPSSKQNYRATMQVRVVQGRRPVPPHAVHVGACVEEPPKRKVVPATCSIVKTCFITTITRLQSMPQTLTSISNTSASRQLHAATCNGVLSSEIRNSRTLTPRSISAWMVAVLVVAN